MLNYLHSRPQSRQLRSDKNLSKPLIRQVDKQQAEKCFKIGKQHQIRNEYDQAKQLYIQATIHNPNYFQAYCNLGTLLRKQFKFLQAINLYLKAKSINNIDPITNYNLANVYRIIGNQQQAIQLYLQIIKLKQNNQQEIGNLYIDSYVNLGVCFKNIGNYDKAIQVYDKIKKIFPNEFSIIYNQAICYQRKLRNMNKKRQGSEMLIQQTVAKTLLLFKQIIKLQPQNQIVEIALIQLKYLQNPTQNVLNNCINQFQNIICKSQLSNDQKEQALRQKAFCLNLLKRYKQSAQEYKKSLENQKKNNNQIEQSIRAVSRQLMTNKYNIKQAQAIQHNNNSNNQIFQKQQDYQTGLNKKSWKLPNKNNEKSQKQKFYQLLNNLLELIHESNFEACFQIIQNNVSQKRIKNQVLIILYSIMSEKLVNKSYAESAFNLYHDYFLKGNINQIIQKDLFTIQAHRAIASILTLLGKNQKAIQHYQIISETYKIDNLQEKQSWQQLYSGLATNYQCQGLHSKAIQEFKKALSLDPTNFVLHFNLAYSQQLAGQYQNAIQSYNQFLQLIQLDLNIEQSPKNNFKIQGLINKFVCDQSMDFNLLNQCEIIDLKIQQFYGKEIKNIIQSFDSNILMSYWLKSADIYEQLITKQIKSKGVSSDNQKLKFYKQKLFSKYLSLLQLPYCPDKQQILINCGNILYEQKQYLNALNFYNRVDKNKNLVILNNIALVYFNLHQFKMALSYLQQLIQNINQQNQKSQQQSLYEQNKIYLMNYQIIKWAGGIDLNQKSIIYKKFQCQCQSEFQNRVQFAKSLIIKLTNRISYHNKQNQRIKSVRSISQIQSASESKIKLNQTKNNSQNNKESSKYSLFQNYQTLIQNILQQKQLQEDWTEPQSKRKHQYLLRYMTKHCLKKHITQKKLIKNNQQYSQKIIKQLLQIIIGCFKQNIPSNQDKIKNNFQQLIIKCRQICKKSSEQKQYNSENIQSIISTILSMFIHLNLTVKYNNKLEKQQIENIEKSQKIIQQIIQKNLSNNKSDTYFLQFQDQFISQSVITPQIYASKQFSIIYNKVELKFKNILQSLMSWQSQLEDQLKYLFKIVQTIAYKRELVEPMKILYKFPHCNNIRNNQQNDNCDICFVKVLNIVKYMWKINQKQFITQNQKQSLLSNNSSEAHQSNKQSNNKPISTFKLKIINLIQQKFPLILQKYLIKQQYDNLLNFSLSQQNLPIQLILIFDTYNCCVEYLNQLSIQIGTKPIQINHKQDVNEIIVIFNKLIKIKCKWNQQSYLNQFLKQLIESPLGIQCQSIFYLDTDISFLWNQNQQLYQLIKPYQVFFNQFSTQNN